MEYKEGSVHGRFQPFHIGHLDYVLSAMKLCKYLWIGITQYDIKDLKKSPEAQHRETLNDNPLSFFERITLIKKVLQNEGVQAECFGFIPFPIDSPEKLRDFLSVQIPIFTTVFDEWNQYKIKLLNEYGYKVLVLYEKKEKEVCGSLIRKRILDDDIKWKKMVHNSIVKDIENLNLKDRLLFSIR